VLDNCFMPMPGARLSPASMNRTLHPAGSAAEQIG